MKPAVCHNNFKIASAIKFHVTLCVEIEHGCDYSQEKEEAKAKRTSSAAGTSLSKIIKFFMFKMIVDSNKTSFYEVFRLNQLPLGIIGFI